MTCHPDALFKRSARQDDLIAAGIADGRSGVGGGGRRDRRGGQGGTGQGQDSGQAGHPAVTAMATVRRCISTPDRSLETDVITEEKATEKRKEEERVGIPTLSVPDGEAGDRRSCRAPVSAGLTSGQSGEAKGVVCRVRARRERTAPPAPAWPGPWSGPWPRRGRRRWSRWRAGTVRRR